MSAMNEAVGVNEFEFMASVPSKETPPSPYALLAELRALSREHGVLVPVALAVAILDVSRQRVYDLINAEVLRSVRVCNTVMITEQSLVAYANSERKSGRPVGAVGTKKLWKVSKDWAGEVLKK